MYKFAFTIITLAIALNKAGSYSPSSHRCSAPQCYNVLSNEKAKLLSPRRRRHVDTPPSPISLSRKTTRNVLFVSPDDNNSSDGTMNTAFPDIARPDPSVLLSSQDDINQKGGVVAIAVGILATTIVLENLLGGLDSLLGGFLGTLLTFTVPLPLGLLYAALGVSHFIYKAEYAEIVPPPGTWGNLWNIPAPGSDKVGLSYQEYHVIWTGIAEIGGGILLALGGLNALPVQIPAFLLFLLTLAVTPANVYMFTHDAQMSFAPPVPYPEGHVFRGVIQCVLLSLLWFLAFN